MAQIVGNFEGQIVGDGFDLGRPQPVLLQFARTNAKALHADAFDLHQPGLRRFEFADGREGTERGKALGFSPGPANLRALREADHAKRRAVLVASADHVEVAHLEDAQWQEAAGKQHSAQGEQGEGVQNGSCRHR